MRASALALLLAALAGGCGSSSSLDDTEPVVTIPDDSVTTSPAPPTELARDPTSSDLDVESAEAVARPRMRFDAASVVRPTAKVEYPADYCGAPQCP